MGDVQYFPVALNIVNNGNTPLENVILSAPFEDTIVSIRSEPRFSKGGMLIPDPKPDTLTNTVEFCFDLAEGERHMVTIVAEGRLLKDRFFLKSQQVMGQLVEIGSKREYAYLQMMVFVLNVLTVLVVVIVVGLSYSMKRRLHDTREELEKMEEEVEKREEEILDLKTKLNAYDREKNQS